MIAAFGNSKVSSRTDGPKHTHQQIEQSISYQLYRKIKSQQKNLPLSPLNGARACPFARVFNICRRLEVVRFAAELL